jgi:hypothetical protein
LSLIISDWAAGGGVSAHRRYIAVPAIVAGRIVPEDRFR